MAATEVLAYKEELAGESGALGSAKTLVSPKNTYLGTPTGWDRESEKLLTRTVLELRLSLIAHRWVELCSNSTVSLRKLNIDFFLQGFGRYRWRS